MKELILLRGIPGSGKSTFAKTLNGPVFEADQFFMVDGEYKFDVTKLKDAHKWCYNSVETVMKGWDSVLPANRVIVSNTFTQEWEMDAYYELAAKYGYRVHSLIVENRHGGVNEHDVPEETIWKMKNRFEIKL